MKAHPFAKSAHDFGAILLNSNLARRWQTISALGAFQIEDGQAHKNSEGERSRQERDENRRRQIVDMKKASDNADPRQNEDRKKRLAQRPAERTRWRI
jgi:cell division protein FtsN